VTTGARRGTDRAAHDGRRVATKLDGVEQLATLLRAADYSAEGLRAHGLEIGLGVRRTDVPTLVRALRADEPLHGLVRLFLLGSALEPGEAEKLGLGIGELITAGVLERRRGRIAASVSITPWRGFLVAHDSDPAGDLWPTHVTGPNPAAETLAQLMLRSPVRSALDLGAGSGILSLLAARHARRVVATDVNPHALRLTALNARLNGIDNIETREGSFFEPVAEERFGSIVSNPPYVIAPDTDLVFRYGSGARDGISRDVLTGAASHLNEGGIAQMLCNWVRGAGEEWPAAPSRWIEGMGCDLLLLHHGTEDALAYASRWNMRLQQVAPDRYPATLDRWLAYYAGEGIQAISSGAAILRRRAAPKNWIHTLEIGSEPRGDGGAQIIDIIAGQDYLAGLTDDRAMLGHVFRLAEPHRLDQSLSFRDERYTIGRAALVREGGIGTRAEVEPALVGLALRFDGATPLERLIDDVATDTGAAQQELVPAALALVRRLIGLGLLLRP
jgi:methylase of polypeptide subunit release factors